MTLNAETTSDGTPQLTLASDASGIATITIANPARMNALTAAMWAALPTLVAKAVTDSAVRVIVLRGAGERAFSAGADISEFETARAGDAVHAYDALNNAAFEALTGCPKPLIAMIHGFCMGGGLGIALACDLRIADTAAQFALPPAKLGLGYNPRWITPILRAVSPADAKLMLFTGRRFPADRALAMGLVTAVVPTADLASTVADLATEIAANAPLTVQGAKAAVDAFSSPGVMPDMAALDRHIAACFTSADYAEGRQAFLEKRKPVFTGR
ncbi:MAG: enoyl-CoA hydratase/isomerase family protein [Hyphomicrobiaceae bacterium]|nr:enoyl-CoA hydratase/isomerase family protein [Hyphomicrobiaceae bacterium]